MTTRKDKQSRWLSAKARQVDVDALLRWGWIKSEAELPKDAVLVNPDKIRGGWSPDLRVLYTDILFKCVDCGVEQVWLARSQKWYCEIAGGHIDSLPKRCRECRKKERERKRLARIALGLQGPDDGA